MIHIHVQYRLNKLVLSQILLNITQLTVFHCSFSHQTESPSSSALYNFFRHGKSHLLWYDLRSPMKNNDNIINAISSCVPKVGVMASLSSWIYHLILFVSTTKFSYQINLSLNETSDDICLITKVSKRKMTSSLSGCNL